MQEDLQVLENLVVEQVLELRVVALLSDAILGLLPELVRDVIVCETLTVEHDHLEEVLDTKLQAGGLELEVALRVWVARMPRDPDSSLVLGRLYSLCLFHLVLSERIAVLANKHFVIDSSNSELHPLDQVDWLEREFCHDLEARHGRISSWKSSTRQTPARARRGRKLRLFAPCVKQL